MQRELTHAGFLSHFHTTIAKAASSFISSIFLLCFALISGSFIRQRVITMSCEGVF